MSLTAEQLIKHREAGARFRATHRDEVNAIQRARYHAQKAAGTFPPSRLKKLRKVIGALTIQETNDNIKSMGNLQGVAGTFAVNEASDAIESLACAERMDLQSRYLLALLKRDAMIWKAHYGKQERCTVGEDDAPIPVRRGTEIKLAGRGAATYIPKTPCRKCGTSLRYVSEWKCVECQRRKNGTRTPASAPATRPPAIGTLAGVPHTRRALGQQQQPKNHIRKIYEPHARFASK